MKRRKKIDVDKLAYEREMLALGAEYIAGADEVGRGPLAGPVVCAAVIMPLGEGELIEGIDDSKKLKPEERERLAALIRERAIAYKVCEESSETIDSINILEATRLCMKRAVEGLSVQPDVVFTDGNFRLQIDLPQQNIVRGDGSRTSCGGTRSRTPSARRASSPRCTATRSCANTINFIRSTGSPCIKATAQSGTPTRYGSTGYAKFTAGRSQKNSGKERRAKRSKIP